MSMRSGECFDAIVIGGGPAGALTARGLARLGWRTALLERGQRHRHKTCGHCLNPRALKTLDGQGLLEATRAIALGATRHLRVHAADGCTLMTPLLQKIGR